jgi:hypothetical protein
MVMDQLRLQQAVTRILTSYLASHQIEVGQVSGLVTSVGQALSPQPPYPEAEAIAPLVRRLRRRADKSGDPDARRIENPDQPDMFDESEARMAEVPIGETAGDTDFEPTLELVPAGSVEPEANTRSKRRPRSGRDLAEANADMALEDGVTVTRIPEVRRSQKR